MIKYIVLKLEEHRTYKVVTETTVGYDSIYAYIPYGIYDEEKAKQKATEIGGIYKEIEIEM